MQAVILAAGKGTRTYPLTLTRPKPLLKAANRTVIEHNLEQLEGLVDEAIIVMGYKGEMVKDLLGDKFGTIKLTYVEQKEQNGTGGALLLCKGILKDRFLAMNGDDFFSRKDMEACMKHRYCVLAKEVHEPSHFGIFELDGNKVKGLEEKPKIPKSNLANIGMYVFEKDIFDHELKESKLDEYEIVDYVRFLVNSGKDVICEKVNGYWLPVPHPWSLLDANAHLLGMLEKSDIKGEVERGVTVKGNIVVGEGTRILSGVYIEGNVIIGKNCKIGPSCYLRGPVAIGDNCHIGQAVEIKNSIIGNGSKVPHLSYVGDSVIGENVNFGAGTKVANLRHDNKNIRSAVKGKLIDTGRRKLGAIVG
ncbi:MAG: bifunctional sugar-1-phosphate nucleotidylyltransferase/acetyltransferase, partial [Candidatus Aenigmarchaeota archaeon]